MRHDSVAMVLEGFLTESTCRASSVARILGAMETGKGAELANGQPCLSLVKFEQVNKEWCLDS